MSVFDFVFDLATNAVSLADQHPYVVWASIGAILALTGVGLPTPEDIWLTLAGFLTYRAGFMNLEPVDGGAVGFVWYYFVMTLVFCSVSNMIGDAACWWLGKRYGLSLRDRIPFAKKLLPDTRVLKAEGWFTKYGGATVFFGRQLAGIRLVTFFTAGVMRMNLKKFLMWDGLGCCLSIPVWLALGAWGSDMFEKVATDATKKDELRELMGSTGGYVLLAGACLIIGFIVYVKISSALKGENLAVELTTIGEEHHQQVEVIEAEKRQARESKRLAKIQDATE